MSMQDKFNDVCLDVDHALNEDLDNRDFGFVLIVCQVDGTLIGGETRVLTNMSDMTAIDLIHAASKHLADEYASGPQHKGNVQ